MSWAGLLIEKAYDTLEGMKACGFFGKSWGPNKPDLARKKEQPRNEVCKCGSNKKYKNCCGR
jgi:uncharacterized protein YecA (UPF0149 family)